MPWTARAAGWSVNGRLCGGSIITTGSTRRGTALKIRLGEHAMKTRAGKEEVKATSA
jgi:hypothetical protein